MLIDDNVYEGLQEFSANLTTTDSGVNIFEPDATAQITDDDGNLWAENQCGFITSLENWAYIISFVFQGRRKSSLLGYTCCYLMYAVGLLWLPILHTNSVLLVCLCIPFRNYHSVQPILIYGHGEWVYGTDNSKNWHG